MSFAIISNINTSFDDEGKRVFTKCEKTIKRVVLTPEIASGEVFKSDVELEMEKLINEQEESFEQEIEDEPIQGEELKENADETNNKTEEDNKPKEEPKPEEESKPEEPISQSNMETELLAFIREECGELTLTMDGLSSGDMFLTRIGENKYHLNKVSTSTGWFKSTNVSTLVGKFSALKMIEDYSVSSPRVSELKSLLESTLEEKSNILAQSCAFQSQVNNLNVENKFLMTIIDKFHKEIETLNNKHDEAQNETINRINNLEHKIMYNKEPREELTFPRQKRCEPNKFNNEIVGKFENSLMLIANFDKTKLRSLANSTIGF